jgi:hypothetical protein
VKGSVDELRSSVDTVKDALLAVGVVVGAGAMGKLYLDIIKSDAALVDFSAETGASIENLSKLSAIAKIGGGNFEGFTEQLGAHGEGPEVRQRRGPARQPRAHFLGVSAKDANGVFRDTGDIAFDVAKALSQYADDGNKVALVQDALGKGAQKYLPLSQGHGRVRRYRRRPRRPSRRSRRRNSRSPSTASTSRSRTTGARWSSSTCRR